MPEKSATCPICGIESRSVFRDGVCSIAIEQADRSRAGPGIASCPVRCCPNLWNAAMDAGIALDVGDRLLSETVALAPS